MCDVFYYLLSSWQKYRWSFCAGKEGLKRRKDKNNFQTTVIIIIICSSNIQHKV